jgi:putative solute:sodium symporter small subunit
MNDTSQKAVHWQRTRNLMMVHLSIWFIFAFVVHWFAPQLNNSTFMKFPLGFYMASQGSLVVFVVQLFFFAWQQDKIDRECGMAEAD